MKKTEVFPKGVSVTGQKGLSASMRFVREIVDTLLDALSDNAANFALIANLGMTTRTLYSLLTLPPKPLTESPDGFHLFYLLNDWLVAIVNLHSW